MICFYSFGVKIFIWKYVLDILVVAYFNLYPIKLLKGNTEVRHLFCNSVCPKVSPRLSVNIICFFCWFRGSYTKLM